MTKNFLIQLLIAILLCFLVCYIGGSISSASLNIKKWIPHVKDMVGAVFVLLSFVAFSALLNTHKDTK